MYPHILVAVDGSAATDQVLFEALKLASNGTHLRVITVVENPLAGYGIPAQTYGFSAVHDGLLQRAQQTLDQVQRDTRHLDHLTVETQLIDLGRQPGADVALAILADAEKYNTDLIVIGTHGRSGLKRIILGSVAEEVMRHALVPVLVVRHALSPESDRSASRHTPEQMHRSLI